MNGCKRESWRVLVAFVARRGRSLFSGGDPDEVSAAAFAVGECGTGFGGEADFFEATCKFGGFGCGPDAEDAAGFEGGLNESQAFCAVEGVVVGFGEAFGTVVDVE